VAKSVQRRLAAILAADVVGYSRLMEADETGTLATLKNLRRELIDPRMATYGGRVVKLMGDGMLAEFPSVVDALACAIDVQEAVARRNVGVPDERRIAFRVGINLGDVMVEEDDLYGDGSMSRRAWSTWPSPAASRSRARCTSTSRVSSMPASPMPASNG
jgi:adenylate cyclase